MSAAAEAGSGLVPDGKARRSRTLDRIDRRILHELMRDAALGVAQLSERVGLSQTPCWKRVRKLEAAGVVLRRVALVDPGRVGLDLTAFVEIEAGDHSPDWREAFQATIATFPAIVEAHRLAGGADYLLKVMTPDAAAYDRFYLAFTQALPCRSVRTRFAMETVAWTTALPIGMEDA